MWRKPLQYAYQIKALVTARQLKLEIPIATVRRDMASKPILAHHADYLKACPAQPTGQNPQNKHIERKLMSRAIDG